MAAFLQLAMRRKFGEQVQWLTLMRASKKGTPLLIAPKGKPKYFGVRSVTEPKLFHIRKIADDVAKRAGEIFPILPGRMTAEPEWPKDDLRAGPITSAVPPRRPGPPAKAHALASRAFVLALVPATCATTPKRWHPKREELCQVAIEPLPTRFSQHQLTDEAFTAC